MSGRVRLGGAAAVVTRGMSRKRLTVITIAALATVLITAVLIAVSGASPLLGLRGLIEGIFSSPYRRGEVLAGAMPLALIALSVTPALRAGIFTVGAEGQLQIGALCSTAVILFLAGTGDVSAPTYFIAGLLSGALGGAIWSVLAAGMKLLWDVNEILSTLLLNYLAALLLSWSLKNWLASSEATATPQSAALPEAAHLPVLIPQTRAHLGLLLVLGAVAALMIWRRSAAARRVDVFAIRPRLALRLGATPSRVVLGTMLVAGAGAGIAGWVQVVGLGDRLFPSVGAGIGFSGVAVALLGGLVPLGVLLAAVVFASLSVGALGVQSLTRTTPSSIAVVIQAVLLLGIASAVSSRARGGTR